jgi:lincosamide nucleotidyltransferase B/F
MVTKQSLQDRLAALGEALSRRDDALALLGLGSVGIETHRLDAFSDLDFFVLVKDGAKHRYLSNLDWLAAAHPLAWHFQNTVDGHKALMTDGVFCEFAVFEVHELGRIPYAPGRFVWRRDEVDEALATSAQTPPGRHGADWLVGEALANLMIGLQRHARGEKLAAMRAVQVHALDRVLEFLEQRRHVSSNASVSRDPYNIDRRIEARQAQLFQSLPLWAGGYEHTVSAALALLSCLEEHEVVPASVATHVRRLAAASDT